MPTLLKTLIIAAFLVAVALASGCQDTPIVAGTGFSMTLTYDPPNPDFSDPAVNTISAAVHAVVLSDTGIPQQGISVLFSATGATMDSNGDFRQTDSHGVATDTARIDRAHAGAEMDITARSGALTKTLTIPTELCTGNLPPRAEITPSAAQTLPAGPVNTLVSAALLDSANSSDPDGTVATYIWTCFTGGPEINTPSVTCTYTYGANPVTYTVTLVVKDAGLPGHPECALSSPPQTVTISVPKGTP